MQAFERITSSQRAQGRNRPRYGIVFAKVKSANDDGTYVLDYLGIPSGAQPTHPARVMTPMAGSERGVHFFPEPGDEVVVAFESGDTTFPVILGSVWNSDSQPPGQAGQSSDNHVRTMVSRSGHELTFDDTPGAEKVLLRSQSGHEVELDDRPVQGKVTVKTAKGLSVALDDTPPGSVTISSGLVSLRLDDATGSLQIEAPGGIQVRGATIALTGNSVTIASAAGGTMVDGVNVRLHIHSGGTIVPPGNTGPPLA